MIPRHSLPFHFRDALAVAFQSAPAVRDVENAYAEALNAGAVLLFPSVRAGIRAAVQAAGGPEAHVVGPAYTCRLVHQALSLTRARTTLVDAAPGSFLMSVEAVRARKPAQNKSVAAGDNQINQPSQRPQTT